MIIYFAGPLFSIAERQFNLDLVHALKEHAPSHAFILPQERAAELLVQENGKRLVFEDCLAMIDKADAVVAVLEGPDADSGTCAELGYAYARKKPIIGFRTDFRGSEDRGLNLMISHICDVLIVNTDLDTTTLATKIAQHLKDVST